MTTLEILDQRGIAYSEHGSNVRKGHVAIKCPWCENDPSQHLNINRETGAFACFRNIQHRGRRPHSLLMKLLNCSREVAQGLLTDTSDLSSVVRRLEQKELFETEPNVVLPDESGMVPLSTKGMSYTRFHDYLDRRGFDHSQQSIMTELYDLRCALIGQFKNRIVFPIHEGKKIIGYTGRAIDGGKLRYLSHPGATVKQHLLWENLLVSGGRRLYIVEGPFDALKVDYVSRISGLSDRATCTFGVNVSPSQIEKMQMLAPEFDKLVILFDNGAYGKALLLQQELRSTGIAARVERVPEGIKDPGAMSWKNVLDLAKRS